MNQKLTPHSGACFSMAEASGGIATTRNRLVSTSMLRRGSALLLACFLGIFVAMPSMAQVTTNSGSGLAASYPSLADAITALNAATISSPVIITLSGDETAPAGGFSITASGDATNTIIIEGSSSTITASASHTAGSLTDAIFKIIGGDFITIQNFTMQENVANTDTTVSTNTKTEFGVALLYASTTNGAQNNTIQNNTISLDRNYLISFGIYSNTRHSATLVSTLAEATTAEGANSFNKVYSNNISNVNVGIAFIGCGTNLAAIGTGNDIGGSSSATGNTLTNWGNGPSRGSIVSMTTSVYGIFMNQQNNDNVSFNTITSASVSVATSQLGGVLKNYSIAAPNTATTSNYNNNTVTLTNTGATTSQMTGITTQGMTTLASATININNNSFLNCSNTGTSITTGSFIGILGTSAPGTLNINGNTFRGTTLGSTGTGSFVAIQQQTNAVVNILNINNNNIGDGTGGAVNYSAAAATSATFSGIVVTSTGAANTCSLSVSNNSFRGITHTSSGTGANTYINTAAPVLSNIISGNSFNNLSINTTGSITFISHSYAIPATGQTIIEGNNIVTAFSKTAAGGTVTLTTTTSTSPTGSINNYINNNFSNISVTGATTLTGFNNTDGGTGSTKTITGNTFNNWTGGTSTINTMNFTYWNGISTLANNTITNITGGGSITAITLGSTSNAATSITVNGNTINNLSSTGTGGTVTGITCANTSTLIDIRNNTIHTLSSTGASSTVVGIAITGAAATNVFENTIHSLSGSGATSPVVNGISVSSGTSVSVSRNKIYNLLQSGAISTTSPAINGILLSGGGATSIRAFNNMIGDLRAPAASLTDAIRGISISASTTNSNYLVSFNTIQLNASSTGTNFGTSGIFHNASITATTANLNLRNNIVVNTSTPNGTGLTVAYRRGGRNSLANYNTSSDRNLFYAGTPGSANLIYADSTNSVQTMSAYKAGTFSSGTVAPRDAFSFSENVTFESTTGSSADFLKIDASVATQIESGGIPISGITTDFFGTTRNATNPDVGAYEAELTGLDLTPPLISYTALPNTALTGNRTLSATISDPSGIPTSGSGLPVLYWNVNNGLYNSATGVHQSGSTYNFSFGAGVSTGDVVRYFIVAQDDASTPNVGAFPSTGAASFTASPPAAGTAPSSPSSYTIVASFSGTYAVGAGETYTSLTDSTGGFFRALNEGAATGNIIVEITSDIAETGQNALNQIADDGNGYTLTIRPSAATNRVISSRVANGLIRLNGADKVIIDGRHGGSGRFITIRNMNTSNPAITFINGASQNELRHINIEAATTSTSNGAVLFSTGANDNNLISNCHIRDRSDSTARPANGIFFSALTNTNTIIENNDIFDFTTNGINLNLAASTTIRNNRIFHNNSSSVTTIFGIFIANANNTSVLANAIYDIRSTATTPAIAGIHYLGVNGTMSAQAINNTIALGTGVTAGTIRGIDYFGWTPNVFEVYHNSVHISGTGVTGSSQTAAFIKRDEANTLNVRNNAFVNTRSNGTGTGNHFAIVISNTVVTTQTLNFNAYFHSGTGGVLGLFNTTNQTTIADWRTASSGDANSINADPAYQSITDLRPALGSAVLNAGTPIATVTTDFAGVTRSISTPTIGAYENAVDVAGPNISFTALTNTTSTAARTLTASITDASGVPTSGAGLPVLYWSINNAAGPFTAATATYISGSNYAFTFGSGVAANDVVHYYIAAQDLVGTPNVGTSPLAGASGFSTNPPAASTPPSTPHSYRISQALNGTIAVGTGETYTSLSANTTAGLFKAINENILTGNVIIEITSNLTETGDVALNQWLEEGAGNYSLTIRPADASTKVIEGTFGGGLIRLNGADRVTIDGRFNGAGQHLTFRNNSTATNTAAIQVASLGTGAGAINNTIRNSIIEAGSITVTSTFGIFAGGSSIGTAGTGADNDNLTIRDNTIRKAFYGIYAAGVASTGVMDDLTIENNTIGSSVSSEVIANRGVRVSNATDVVVSGNTIFGFRTASATIQTTGIEFASNITNSKISRNEIYDLIYTATSNRAGQGISISTVADANVEVSNNVIYGLGGHGSVIALNNSWGIMILSGGGINVHHNSINQTGTFTNAATNIHGGIYIANGTTTLNISNNLVASQASVGTFYNIYSLAATTAFSSLNRNLYFIPGSTPASTTRHTGFLTSARTTLGDWQTATSLEANSLSADPLFTSATNLRPTSGSPALGAGQVVSGITVDFLGNTRSGSNPSIGAYETALINTWTGSGTWTTSSNWSLGTPAAGDNVVIGSGTVEATSAGNTINSITVNSGATVTIPNGASLTVNGALTNNGTFTVQNGGHLLQGASSTIGGSGTFNATRNSGNTSNLVYNMWSSPNSTSTLSNLGGTDWYFFNETSQAWSNTGLTGSSVMSAGRGYSSTGAGNVTFTGTFNNGAVTPAVGTSGQGWNLVGNPYPSSVSGTSFLAGNTNIEGTLWFWSQPTAATVGNSGGDYATWTTLGGTAGSAGGATPDGNIGLAQGFFVKANSGSTVSFANSMRSANAGSNFRLAGERAWFNLTGSNNLFNQILLGFSSGASDQRDAADATKLKGNTQIAFYSLLGADQLAIQAMAERGTATRIVPVGFDVATAGAYSLFLDRTESMPANVDIFLKDNLTGSMHNLRNQAYGFAVANAGSFTNRFEIHFGVGLATSVNSLTAENVRIFGAGQSLFVQGFAEGTVVERFEVRDAAGRLVMELNRPQNADLERMEMNVAAGVYLARIVTNNGIKTERVYLSK